MAGMCCGLNISETQTTTVVEPSPRSKVMEIHQFNFGLIDSAVAPPLDSGRKRKRPKVDTVVPISPPAKKCRPLVLERKPFDLTQPASGTTFVCGRRRDMEDAVAIHPSFCGENSFFGVFDGHGCSHVATRCKDRMHEIVRDELENGGKPSWERVMSESFLKMDKDVTDWSSGAAVSTSKCRCEMRTPQCDSAGSTAVVAVVSPDEIVVSNCGDSRAVLCRNGVAIPLSVDHKPDRPDELRRIEDSGGRVIYWDGPRVLGVLAMSRAIGDNYLKPYVIPEPEVTVTERTAEDECLILASDGLWDVVSNQTACGVARMCLQPRNSGVAADGEISDQACSDASMLLTKLALARRSTDNVSVVVVDLRRGR